MPLKQSLQSSVSGLEQAQKSSAVLGHWLKQSRLRGSILQASENSIILETWLIPKIQSFLGQFGPFTSTNIPAVTKT